MLLNRVPAPLADIEEFRIITEVCEQPEFDTLWASVGTALDDQFLATATESGISRLEEMCGIFPKSGDSLEDRRFKLSSVYIEQRPTTVRFLKRQLELLCGKDNYSVEVDGSEYTLTVRLALVSKSSLNAAKELIGKIKPANIVADIDLLYNRYGAYAGRTYGQMAAYTHETLRSEVINNGN